MSMKADYDESQPQHKLIILSILTSIIVIIIMTIGVILYFKLTVSDLTDINETNYGVSVDLEKLREYESNYLNNKDDKKVTINEAMFIISNTY